MFVRRRWLAGGLAVAATLGAMVGPGSVHAGNEKVLLDGLNSPKGIAVGADGALIIAQGAFGPPDPVLRYHPRLFRREGGAIPVTDPFNLVDVAISPLDGTGWAIAGDGFLYHQLADGSIEPVLNIVEYQAADPDPVDIDDPPNPGESNPYGLTVMPSGDALVADAAGNDVIRVTPAGDATTVARFDIEVVSTADVPFPFPFPEVPAEAVPTTVVVGPDGAIYVGELKGFPFKTGSSHVWRIDPAADGVTCSVTAPEPGCTVFQGGFSGIQDIVFDRHGRMYVYELAVGGVWPFEEALMAGGTVPFPPAVLLKVTQPGTPKARIKELAAGELSQPGGIVATREGGVFVTDGMFTGGRLLKVG